MEGTYELISAVDEDDIDTVRRIISSWRPHHLASLGWADCLLRNAIELRHNEVAKELLLRGWNVNSKTEKHSDTPLHLSVNNGDIEIVDMLLDRGTQISAINDRGMTPLHCAAQKGSVTIVERLLNRRADVNCATNSSIDLQYTPLHYACEQRNEQIVELLLGNGADINARTARGATALAIAVECRHEKNVKMLLDHGGADINGSQPILRFAVKNRNVNMTKLLLSSGANIYDPYDLLRAAIKTNCIEMVKIIFQYFSDLDINALHASGRAPLHYVVDADREHIHYYSDEDIDLIRGKIAEFLFSRGASVDLRTEHGNTALVACGVVYLGIGS